MGQNAVTKVVLALVLFLGLLVPALAIDAAIEQSTETVIRQARATLDAAKAQIVPDSLTKEQLVQTRTSLDRITIDVKAAAKALEQPEAEVAAQISKLGPPPTDGQVEPQEIRVQRNSLNTQSANLLALRKQLELLGVETDQTFARLSAFERDQFLQRIFASGRSALDPRLWLEAADGAGLFLQRLGNLSSNWWLTVRNQANLGALAASAVVLVLVWVGLLRARSTYQRLVPQSPQGADEPTASPVRRLWNVIIGLAATAAIIFLVIAIATLGLEAAGIYTSHLDLVVSAVIGTAVPTVLYARLAQLVCQPGNPAARLVAIETGAARSLTLITLVSAFAYMAGSELTDLATSLTIPFEFSVGVSALTALVLIALLAVSLLLIRKEAAKGIALGNKPYFLTWILKFTPVFWGLLGVALGALIFGYVSLGLFIVGNILETALLAVILGVLHAFAHAVADTAMQPETHIGRNLRRMTGFGEAAIARLLLAFRTTTDIGATALSLIGLFALWAVSLVNFTSMLRTAANGFAIGNISISPMALLAAAFILVVGIAITRYVTAWLQRRVLTATRLDKGVQDSIRTGAGYFGYILAAGFALSAAGVNFSNLAIIAGALGVGIGFGLQSIVNNFVSGLILLAERPVRVGDWVVTAAGEGIVRTINVRATEIETFDNCTIFIPNSNLITGAVSNWTHRDNVGRFSVNFAVNYGVDPELIGKQVKDIVAAHPKVLRLPEPIAILSRLSPTAMEFEVKGHVSDVYEAVHVASDVRTAIIKALGKKHLAIAPINPVSLPKK